MTSTSCTFVASMNTNDRVIVALDFGSEAEAMALVEQLGATASSYKVGLQLLTAEGPSIVRWLVGQGKKVFLDLKLHEIPNSVASAVAVAGSLGASMVTVHASGGSAVLRAAVKAAQPFPHLQVLALTVITSMAEQDLAEIGVPGSVLAQVERLAALAAAAGCHGVVASAQEAARLREVLPAKMLIVTPGTQLAGEATNDQNRTATPAQAIQAGATHLVMGRSIARTASPVAAFTSICGEVAEATEHRHG
jgi:orotidine-5'-phosphate decarboxylase